MDRRQVAAAGHEGDERTARAGLSASEPAVRAAALTALQRIGALAPQELERALSDPDPAVRRRAAMLAAQHPSVDVVPLLGDADPLVAEMAAYACGEQPPRPQVVGALAGVASAHPDALVREAAVAALGALGDRDGLSAILAAMDDKPAVRRRAVLALAPFDGDEVIAALRRALDDRDWQVRQAAEDLLR